LAASWKKVLLNQFHDILPGSSIPQVYEQAQRDYAEVQQACESMITQAMQHLAAQGVAAENSPTLVVFNTLSWPRRTPVEVQIPSLPKSFTVVDAQGKLVDTQILSTTNESMRFLFDANVPALGYATFHLHAENEKTKHKSGPWAKAHGTILENGYFRARFDRRGRLVSLWDRRTQREVIAKGKDGNLLQTFEEAPAAWEAWDINADFENKPFDLFHCQSVEVGESGPLRASLRIVFASAHSRIEQEVFIYRDFPRLDFVTHIDWHEQRTLLKVAFPVDVLSSFATYEIQYGSVQRPTHRNTSWDAAKFEVAAQKWADLSEANYGVSLLNDCKYGYDILENQLRLTVLRSPYAPHPLEPHLKVDWGNVVDQGQHELVYSLYPHPGDWRSAGTVEAAYELNVPQRVIVLSSQKGITGGQFEFMRVRANNVVVEACKPAEDGKGLIVRLYEAHGGRGPADLIFFAALKRVELVNLLEETIAPAPHEGNVVQLYFAPFEIKTLRVIW
jgi:alpha-mannosidase